MPLLTKIQIAKFMATGKVDEIESEGMDEGRFFVHLKAPYCYAIWGDDIQRTKSFGGYREAWDEVKNCKTEQAKS